MPDNPKAPEALTPEQVRERTNQSPAMPLMYFNYVRVASSFYDVRMFFGNGTINAKGEQSFTEELCVTVSPEFAKILRDNLTEQLDKYIARFGAIRDPVAVEQTQTAAKAKTGKPS